LDEAVLVNPNYERERRAFDMWLMDNQHIKEEIDKISERGGIEPSYPIWLFRVPEGEQLNAAKRHADNQVSRAKRLREVRAEAEAHRIAVRSGERVYIDGLAKQGCELTYMFVLGYIVALAFKPSGKPNEVYVWFSVCTPEDALERKRWKHESRKRLLERVEKDDDVHSFACLVQGVGSMAPVQRARFARRRFYEHAQMTDRGMPHELVKLLRMNEATAFAFPHRWREMLCVAHDMARPRVAKKHPPAMREHDF
jgi:hypothetical protein